MSENYAVFTYASAAPGGLPALHFPQHLGAVRTGIEDLALEYDDQARELLLVLTLSNGNSPARELIGATYSDLVAALVDHISFELGLPLDPPLPRVYQDLEGNRVLFVSGTASAQAFGSAVLAGQTDDFLRRISTLVPSSTLLHEFNAAARIVDSVQQFVAYWGLLTHIVGKGTVSAVEAHLHSQHVPDEPAPGPHGPETKFARVRGEISHPVDRHVLVSDLPDRAKTVLPELRDIVRAAVANELSLPR